MFNWYKYRITIPQEMTHVADTGGVEGDLYYDASAKIVMVISERKSEFKSVKDYIDCSREQLEEQLRYFYTDSTLTLVNCSRSPYYPEESTAILFHVSILPYGFNTCLVYFFHHRHKDFQFSFTYKEESGKRLGPYIDSIMQTLILK